MAIIDNIVDITITKEGAAVTVASFGIPLLITNELPKVGVTFDVVKSYSGLTSVAEDFVTTSETYKAASAILSQNPSVNTLFIGNGVAQDGTTPPTSIIDTINAVSAKRNDWYALAIVGFTQGDIAAALSDIAAAVNAQRKIALIWLDDVSYGGVNDTSIFNLGSDRIAAIYHKDTYKAEVPAQDAIGLEAYPDGLASDDPAYADLPEQIKLQYPDGIPPYVPAKPAIPAVSREYAAAAWLGRMLPYEPGAATWAYKLLTGITPDMISPSDFETARKNKITTYATVGGVNVTLGGAVAGVNGFMDITVGIDFIYARLQERIFGLLASMPKLPYSDAGISIVGNAINAVLNLAADRGIIDRGTINVQLPVYADLQAQQPAQIEARHLPDVKFSATLVGAIHTVKINGTVSV